VDHRSGWCDLGSCGAQGRNGRWHDLVWGGVPARLATVRLVALDGSAVLSPGASIQATANLDGDFEIDEVPAGHYAAGAELAGFVPTFEGEANDEIVHSFQRGTGIALHTVAVMNGGTTSIDLVLGTGSVLSGVVTFSDGSPARTVRLAALQILPQSDALREGEPRVAQEATTDDRGLYRVAGIAAGTYTIRVQVPQRAAQVNGGAVYLGNSSDLRSARHITLGTGDLVTELDLVIPLPNTR
jgi:hypothetical protein